MDNPEKLATLGNIHDRTFAVIVSELVVQSYYSFYNKSTMYYHTMNNIKGKSGSSIGTLTFPSSLQQYDNVKSDALLTVIFGSSPPKSNV